MSQVLVTGANGYIGRHLVPALVEQGHTVIGLDRQPGDSATTAFHLGDLNDEAVTRGAVEGAEVVVHLAAAKDDWGISESEYRRDNVEATSRLIRAGRDAGVREWVFYSTVSVYGPSDEPADETAPHRPHHAYGRSKGRGPVRRVCRGGPQRPGPPGPTSVVFGPGHPSITNVSRLIEATARGRFLMAGKGEAVKTTSYIENLVAATLFLMARMAPGVAGYIVTDDPRLTTGELVANVSRRLERRPPRWSLPSQSLCPWRRLETSLARSRTETSPSHRPGSRSSTPAPTSPLRSCALWVSSSLSASPKRSTVLSRGTYPTIEWPQRSPSSSTSAAADGNRKA